MGYWRAQYEKFKQAIADRSVETFFLASSENSRQMRATYTLLGNMTDFLEWLEYQAMLEEANMSSGSVFTTIGGC